jgi:hypothetical protein
MTGINNPLCRVQQFLVLLSGFTSGHSTQGVFLCRRNYGKTICCEKAKDESEH